MIQRIQSLFLFLAAASGFGLFGLPFASTKESVEGSALLNDSIFNIYDHIGLLILFVLAGTLAFVSIFLFKNRKLQMNIGRGAIVANILGIVLGIILFLQDSITLENVAISDSLGVSLPVLFMIFVFLALRFIKKDEQIVNSMDRLR